MAEVFGIIASTITIIEGIKETYKAIKYLNDLPKAFEQVNQSLPLALDTLNAAELQLKGSTDPNSADTIKPIILKCEAKATELHTIFQKINERRELEEQKNGKKWSAALQAFYRTTVEKLGKAHRVEGLMQDILTSLEELAINQTLKSMTQQQIKDWGDALDKLLEVKDNSSQEKIVDADELEACLQSLKIGARAIDERLQTIAPAHTGTCDWLFQTDQFKSWRSRTEVSENNGILWIKGHPGAGKSTLMKHAWNHCRNNMKNHIKAAYFFNARGAGIEKSFAGMLRSLLYQIFAAEIECEKTRQEHEEGESSSESQERLPGGENKPSLFYELFLPIFREKQKWSPKQVSRLQWDELELLEFALSTLPKYRNKPLVLFLDALDECEEPEVERVVRFLGDLSNKALEGGATIYICLSSRHYPSIDLNKKISLNVDSGRKEHQEDILKYISDRLDHLDEEIIAKIREKASGIFMWVVLVVNLLNKDFREGNIAAMQDRLKTVPSGLAEIFETLIDRNDLEFPKTILLFQWVLFAKRPLTLGELYFGLGETSEIESSLEFGLTPEAVDGFKRRIVTLSKGLVEIYEPERFVDELGETHYSILSVQFIHQSVTDFFIRHKKLHTLSLDLSINPDSKSHYRLAEICWSHLVKLKGDSVRNMRIARQNGTIRFDAALAFAIYAGSYFLTHLDIAAQELSEVGDMVWKLHQDSETSDLLKRLHVCSSTQDCVLKLIKASPDSFLNILSAHGHNNIIKVLIDLGVDLNTSQGILGTPLNVAAYTGNNETIELLLDHGARIHTPSGIFRYHYLHLFLPDPDHEENPEDDWLECNFEYYYLTVPDPDNDACQIYTPIYHPRYIAKKPSEKGMVFGDAIQLAAYRRHESTIELLLKRGADINFQGGTLSTGLQVAFRASNRKAVDLLLKNGADINAQGGRFGNTLQAAILDRDFDLEILTKLLDQGADVNLEGGPLGNALQAAVYMKSWCVIETLLRHGANANAQGGPYGNALQAAICRNLLGAVGLLLLHGADANAQGGPYGNALQAAICLDSGKSIVHHLIDQGADPNATGGPYGSVLLAVMSDGRMIDVTTDLLERGADPNGQGKLSGKALKTAIALKNDSIVSELLEKGAYPDDSIVHEAIRAGDHEILSQVLASRSSWDDKKHNQPLALLSDPDTQENIPSKRREIIQMVLSHIPQIYMISLHILSTSVLLLMLYVFIYGGCSIRFINRELIVYY